MHWWQKIALLALGGALGAVCRAGLSIVVQGRLAQRLPGWPAFPWGTASVNLAGCFGFGLAWALLETRWQHAEALRLLVLTGFMGAFTTFSTFAFDTAELGTSRLALALGNLLLQNVAGLLLVVAGLALGRVL